MIHVFLYLAICYGITLILLRALRILWYRCDANQKVCWQKVCWSSYAAVFALAVLAYPYAIVPVQTALYGRELAAAIQRSHYGKDNGGDKLLVVRVLQVTPTSAKVYVIVPCRNYYATAKNLNDRRFTEDKVGIIVSLRRNGGWEPYQQNYAKFSVCGSY
jgi:hypothetical protein